MRQDFMHRFGLRSAQATPFSLEDLPMRAGSFHIALFPGLFELRPLSGEAPRGGPHDTAVLHPPFFLDAALSADDDSHPLTDAPDLSAVLGGLGAGDALLFAPDDGKLAGNVFLVVDGNNEAGFQQGEDFVFAFPAPIDPPTVLTTHTEVPT